MCGTCCYKMAEDYVKRIPIYPDEADKLIEIAKNREINFKIIEDLVFPDIQNEKILVLTYRIRLDNELNRCPFYTEVDGCSIHASKPLACQSYPLALKRVDAFNFSISIDPLCNFVIQNYDELALTDLEKLKMIFQDEYPKAEKFYRKNKSLMFKIRELEVTNTIKIPREISLDCFNEQLRNWEREELRVDEEETTDF